MDSVYLARPTVVPAPNTKQWHICCCKQQILSPSKVRKLRTAQKCFASLRNRREKGEDRSIDIDRRRLLLSSSTLGMSALIAEKGKADPFPAPDKGHCVNPPSDLPPNANVPGGCCPPFESKTTIADFIFPTGPVRTRPAAQLVNADYIRKYEKAVSHMKALPEDDPHSFAQQAKIHCAYCNGAYLVGSDKEEYQVHFGWFFLPFHRWYLYFYERIVASYSGDDKFTLPFWNWDAMDGMRIPDMYTKIGSPLYGENRNTCHQSPMMVNLAQPESCDDASVCSNYSIIYTQMVSAATDYKCFHGGEYRYIPGEKQKELRSGTLESSPHNVVHNWTGSSSKLPNTPNGEDMGSFYSAARDPIFYSHHANIDRMWTVWNDNLCGENYRDNDLLDSKFVFYDENKKLVQVRAGDCYDTSKLGYEYQELNLPWLERGHAIKKAGKLWSKPSTLGFVEADDQPKFLTVPLTFLLTRRIPAKIAEEYEYLYIEGIVVDMSQNTSFNIFINFPDANRYSSCASPHFAGTFATLGHGIAMTKAISYQIGISESLEDVGASEDKYVLITLVPQAAEFMRGKTAIQFTTIKPKYHTK